MFLLPSRKETVDDSEEDARDDRVCKLIFNNVKQKIKFMSCGSKKYNISKSWLWQSQVKLPKATFSTEKKTIPDDRTINQCHSSFVFRTLFVLWWRNIIFERFLKSLLQFATMINCFDDELCIVFWLVWLFATEGYFFWCFLMTSHFGGERKSIYDDRE